MDGFDRLPDCLIIVVFNSVSDVRTLIRCRAVSKRFNSLVPQTESLFLKIDRVISPDSDSFVMDFFKSVFKSLYGFIPPKTLPFLKNSQKSPVEILRGFERIRRLKMKLPTGDIRIDEGGVVKWKAEFGKSLKKSVILGFNAIRKSPTMAISSEVEFSKRVKKRVVWTISALVAAAARHYLLKEVVEEHGKLERIEVEDEEEEGLVIMEKEGIKEWINCRKQKSEEDEERERRRSRVPGVKMKMREVAGCLELKGGVWVEGGTLVVVGPNWNESGTHEEKDDDDDVAVEAFDGVYREVVEALMKKGRSYVLEMNSF